MDDKRRRQIQLDCLLDMFRDRIEENVVYIVFSENDGRIDTTIDQLMSISSCAFTGHYFETPKPFSAQQLSPNSDSSHKLKSPLCSSASGQKLNVGNRPTDQTEAVGINNSVDSIGGSKLKSRTKDSSNTEHDVEDAESGLDIAQRIERLQKSIVDLLVEKKSSHDKASQYLSRKMYPVTSYYSELASQYRRVIEQKTSQLVELLLEKSKDCNYIDLHGLNPIQARLVVSEFLEARQHKLMIDKQGQTTVDIITGWGKHSLTQGQRIRPAIVSLLRESGYDYHHLNKGALRVTIRRC